MDNIKEALEYAVQLADAKLHLVNGYTYSDKKLYEVKDIKDELADSIKVSSLTSIVDYLKQNIDVLVLDRLFINVISPTTVEVVSVLNKDKAREVYLLSNALTPKIIFEQFYPNENFNILLQSAFIDNDDRAALLKIVSCVSDEQTQTTTYVILKWRFLAILKLLL